MAVDGSLASLADSLADSPAATVTAASGSTMGCVMDRHDARITAAVAMASTRGQRQEVSSSCHP
jgi:hypothetical protein